MEHKKKIEFFDFMMFWGFILFILGLLGVLQIALLEGIFIFYIIGGTIFLIGFLMLIILIIVDKKGKL